MPEVISALETYVYIEPETYQSTTYTCTSALKTFVIDNRYNSFQSDLKIEVIPQSDSSIAFSTGDILINHGLSNNQNQKLSLSSGLTISYGSQLTIDNMVVSNNNTELTIYSLNSPLFISENQQDTFELLGTIIGTINIVVSYKKSSGSQEDQLYVQGFTINQNDSIKSLGKKRTVYNLLESTTYDFSIDQLWYKNFLYDNKSTYRIKFNTDFNVTSINQYTYYLCNCRFSNLNINQGEVNYRRQE